MPRIIATLSLFASLLLVAAGVRAQDAVPATADATAPQRRRRTVRNCRRTPA